jgi:hypothetical protein
VLSGKVGGGITLPFSTRAIVDFAKDYFESELPG